jgi:hypothetical protein
MATFEISGANTAGGNSSVLIKFKLDVPDGEALLQFTYGSFGWQYNITTAKYEWESLGIDHNYLAQTVVDITPTGLSTNYIDANFLYSSFSEYFAGIETVTLGQVYVNHDPLGTPAISGTAIEGEMLTAVTSAVADADGIGAFSYQWLLGDDDISGATSSSYTLMADDVGHEISVQISYTDGRGKIESLQSGRSDTVKMRNNDPSGQPIIEGTATIGETLMVNTESITDDDGLGEFFYQWMRDGAAIPGADSSTYLVSADDGDSVLSVQVSYIDQLGTLESLTSDNTSTIVSPHEYADNFTITPSFGTSVYEGTLPVAEEGSGNQISFTINQIDPQIRSVYVALKPATGQTTDFWDNFWSNKIGGEPADQFALGTFKSVDGGPVTVSYTLNADSAVEENETFVFSVYEDNMDFALGGKAIKSFEFSVLDDDTTLTFTSELYDRSGEAISGFQLSTSSGSAIENYVTSGTGSFDWSSALGATVEFASATAYSNSSKAVTSADALDALKLSVGLTPSNGTPAAYDYIAADFNRDGKVTSSDALDILKYAVGLEVERDADWVFIRSDDDLSAVGKNSIEYDTNILIEDITSDIEIGIIGILIGDVNDSYSDYIT